MTTNTMCAHCGSLNGGHTLACQSIHSDSDKPAQVPAPDANRRRDTCTDSDNCRRCSEDAKTPHSGIPRSGSNITETARAIQAGKGVSLTPEQENAVARASLEQLRDEREAVLKDYVDDYEYLFETEEGADACYRPNERERILIEDATNRIVVSVSYSMKPPPRTLPNLSTGIGCAW
jgi:hypothetical protein